MKIRISLLITICIALTVSLFTESTMAWFYNSASKDLIFETGNIKFKISGELVGVGEQENEDGYIVVVPGQFITDMDGDMILTNQSNIDTELRIQIVYNYLIPDENGTPTQSPDIVYNPDDDDLAQFMDFHLQDKWIFVTEQISDDPADGTINCFEYKYDDDLLKTDRAAYTIPKVAPGDPGEEISLLDEISFSGDNITADFSGSYFSIKFIFLVKQKNIVNWQQLGELTFHVTT